MRRRAFTLLELLMSILVIGVLMGLIIGGALAVTRAARSTADAQALRSIRLGVETFKGEFGFPPPLIRDQQSSNPGVVQAGAPARVKVLSVTSAPDQTFLRTVPAPVGPDPFGADKRFSEQSLAVYLAGALSAALGGAAPAGMPIDGVGGVGFYAPRSDGSFDIPDDVLRGTASASRRAGRVFEPLVNLTKASPKLFTDPADTTKVELRDVRNVVVRYYRWLPGKVGVAGNPVDDWNDQNVPYIVGRDPGRAPFNTPPLNAFKTPPGRDLSKAPELRTATWAVVAAGPNGVFGDEPVSDIARALGLSNDGTPETEVRLRSLAAEDNAVEVGS